MWKTSRAAAATFGIIVTLGVVTSAGQLATVQNSEYRHIETDVQFPVPAGWSVLNTAPSSDGGDQAYLRDAASPQTYVAVWMKKEENTPAQVEARLDQVVGLKTTQRLEMGATDFRIHPESVRRLSIGNYRAMTATADFQTTPQSVTEYFIWIFTEHTRVQFDVRGTASDASQAMARLQSIVQAARIP